jgi:hypothetical protein
MRNIAFFSKANKVKAYQLKVSLLLSCVPIICCLLLTGLVFFFAQQNLYFLETGGLIVNDQIRQAYHDQIQLELADVVWYVFALVCLTFGTSYFLIGWAVSPFVNAERLLRAQIREPNRALRETDWLSESPSFHRVIWGLAQTVRDRNHPFDQIPVARYSFNYLYFVKFVISFFFISGATGYVLGIIFDTVYLKIVNLAISLVRMNNRGYYFLAQEELLRHGVNFTVAISCLVYGIIGLYVTRYMSNMIFVFTRAVREHHFPLRLRHSDIYHDLADAISETAKVAGIGKKD